jgi:hypothetical protein
MKNLVLACLTLGLITGCSTPERVSKLEGEGTKHVFEYPYDAVWRASVDATQQGDLQVVTADRARGYISARRTIQPHTFGENVGLWVRSTGPSRTEVEVVSRQAGPPVAWLKNWENEIIRAIAANVTRETPAVGATGTGTQILPGNTVVVPESRTTVVVPETRVDTERRLEQLRQEEATREAELRREESDRRRQELRTEIDRLREELRIQQERLADLEKEVK